MSGLPRDWTVIPLKKGTRKIGSGATPRGGAEVYLPSGPAALIRSQNVYNGEFKHEGLAYITEVHARELDGVEVLPNDVLLNITGNSVARSCMAPDLGLPTRVNQHVAIIRADECTLHGTYLGYWLVLPDTQARLLGMAGAGATRDALTKAMIESLAVPAPDFPEQKAIAEVLAALDHKIELNRGMGRTLEAMAQALFHSWFVSFDPVRARAEGRNTGLPHDLTALFPVALKDTPKGQIPIDWEWSEIGEEFSLTMGQSPPGDTYNSQGLGLPFYQGRSDFGDRFPSPRIYCTAPTRRAYPGDSLVSVRAPVGDLNVADGDCAIGRGVAAVRHSSKSVSYTYYTLLNLRPAFEVFEGEGTVFGSINKSDFSRLACIRPGPQLIRRYDDVVNTFDQKIAELHRETRTLAALRDALLPGLLSGAVRVEKIST